MSDSTKSGQASDADLCAYLDDECGPGQRRRAEGALAQDPALSRKLAVWRRNDSALRAAFSANRPHVRAPNSAEPPLAAAVEAHKRRSDWAIAAAFLTGVVAASGAFMIANLLLN